MHHVVSVFLLYTIRDPGAYCFLRIAFCCCCCCCCYFLRLLLLQIQGPVFGEFTMYPDGGNPLVQQEFEELVSACASSIGLCILSAVLLLCCYCAATVLLLSYAASTIDTFHGVQSSTWLY